MYGHGIYVGDKKHLFNKDCLLMKHETDDSKYLAQFDALHLIEAFCWHEFDKQDFVNIEEYGKY